MKYKLVLLFTLGVLFSCSNKSNEHLTKKPIDGFYWAEIVYKTINPPTKVSGIYIFSNNEISIFYRNPKEFAYVEHKAVFKYYFKDDLIYACNCGTNDCVNTNNYTENYKIVSNETTDREQIVKLTNGVIDVTLTKEKGVGLEVKNW